MERRKFLESACKACMLAGAGLLMSELTACSPSTKIMQLPVTMNTVSVPLSSFETESMQIVRPDGWLYNIAVRKTGTDQFEALLLECTHQRNQLITTSSGYICTLHGSRYNLDGQVVKGPAERPLKNFVSNVDKDQLIIQLKLTS